MRERKSWAFLLTWIFFASKFALGSTPTKPVIGSSCHSDDASQICLGLKYVVYADHDGKPTASRAMLAKDLDGINKIWGKYGIEFQVDEYDVVQPEKFGLRYNTAESSELDAIRKTFDNNTDLLVVVTGPWDRKGSLGDSSANSWTSMPGAPPYGVILEKPVATFPNIIAHELGHYLNLEHVTDTTDVMNPVIYASSTKLYDEQSRTARLAAENFWRNTWR